MKKLNQSDHECVPDTTPAPNHRKGSRSRSQMTRRDTEKPSKSKLDKAVDEAGRESFPCSDPPAY